MKKLLRDAAGEGPRDPEGAAQKAMRPELASRFYDKVDVVPVYSEAEGETHYCIELDSKRLKTPARRALQLPSNTAAKIIAEEWLAQEKNIDPARMPATRLVNTAYDGIIDDPQAVVEDMLKFAISDLLCYRANSPIELAELQASKWDPVLDWMQSEIGANFETTQSLIQITQPKAAVDAVGIALKQWQHPIQIAALHTFTNLTGSIILSIAIAKEEYSAQAAWEIAHVDEDWNANLWGEDFEARQRRDNRWLEMSAADQLFKAVSSV